MCDGLEAVLHGVEFDQGHILLIGIAEYVDCLYFAELAEDIVESMLFANLSLQRTHMQSLRRRVYSQRTVSSKSMSNHRYRS